MDCIRGMFPYINVPFISSTSISDMFTGCITCQPFGMMKRRSGQDDAKPSREVKTISSLVDKLAAACDQKIGPNPIVHSQNLRSSNSFYQRPCNRQKSFSLDMNHEKFTPCEKRSFTTNDLHQNSPNQSDYGKIKRISRNNSKIHTEKRTFEKSMVAPPRRKKRPAPQRLTESNSRDYSIELNLEREIRKNYRNMQMNNLDEPGVFKSRSSSSDEPVTDERNNNTNFNNNNNINQNFNRQYTSASNLTNNNNNNNNTNVKVNNKSGCSNLAVVSDSLESNAMHFSKSDSVSHENCTRIDSNNFVSDHKLHENKVYYKNSGLDRFGNYEHGDDVDEVIVCESIVNSDPKSENHVQVKPPLRPPPPRMQPYKKSPTPPKDSTYTKFYTDNFYQDHCEVMSNRSYDEPFEQIVQLQPNMVPFLQNALAIWKAKGCIPSCNKPQQQQQQQHQTKNQEEHHSQDHHHHSASVVEQDKVLVQDNSIPVVFCGLLPIHQLNDGKWLQSIRPLNGAPGNIAATVPMKKSDCCNNCNTNSGINNNNSASIAFNKSSCSSRDSKQETDCPMRSASDRHQIEKDVRIVVGGRCTSRKSSKENSIDTNDDAGEACSEFDKTTHSDKRTEMDCCHYAETDRCEL